MSISASYSAVKQPGRRFGPPPEPPLPCSTFPMQYRHRCIYYRGVSGRRVSAEALANPIWVDGRDPVERARHLGLTPKQRRRAEKKQRTEAARRAAR